VCGRDFEVEIGTGEDMFEALDERDTSYLYRGSQGAQHLLVSLRAMLVSSELAIPRGHMDLALVDPSNGVPITEPVSVGVALDARDTHVDVLGYFYVIASPDQIIGRDVLLTAEISPVGIDQVGRGAARLRVAWAPQDTGAF
jgi:hypothetical protein